MKTPLQCAVLASLAVLTLAPAGARAQDHGPLKPPHEVTLDIDHDGTLDRAVLTENPGTGSADLAVYLGVGAGRLDPSRKPAVVKKNITIARILRFESAGNGSLIVMSGCGGCSNDYATTLTVVYRHGAFWVGAVTYDWDTRAAQGTCTINFIAGKGVKSRGLTKTKPIKGRFVPVRLADWSNNDRPEICN